MPHAPEMRFRVALLLSLCSALAGGSPLPDITLGSYGFEARLTYGFLVAHRPMLRLLQEEHLRSFEVSLLFPSTGKKEWERGFRFPDRGLHLAIIDLGSRKLLGTGIAVYPFVDFPLFFGNDWSCRLRYGMGLGYVQHTFDPEENYKNTALSSHLNGTIHFDLHVNKCIGQRGAFDAGIGITHYSNGATALPNLGINLAAAHIGYRRYFGERRALHKETHDQRQLRPGMTLFLSGSLKEIYPPLGPLYFASTLSGDYLLPLNPKIDAAVGADLFYDASLRVRMEASEDVQQPVSTNFRPSVHGGLQFNLDPLGLIFNLGYYPYTRFKDDGRYFHRIGLRYYFDRLFVCMNLKTHYARADFIEWGVGWRFRSTSPKP